MDLDIYFPNLNEMIFSDMKINRLNVNFILLSKLKSLCFERCEIKNLNWDQNFNYENFDHDLSFLIFLFKFSCLEYISIKDLKFDNPWTAINHKINSFETLEYVHIDNSGSSIFALFLKNLSCSTALTVLKVSVCGDTISNFLELSNSNITKTVEEIK
ncbi:hypothetical protein CWI37_0105p0050 [Hamiltosporidium tvaerminnensis]|uniref:Uncharacterized protein n=1 Tax=Hamiltosporidium tvaerminnensis TaxID=1176355 RepID=A0A4Q9LA64_9MICR|nr:hypothetical protein CWI37_0105p0050 [Hamiltosporidium tvaerminnensis]